MGYRKAENVMELQKSLVVEKKLGKCKKCYVGENILWKFEKY